MWTMYINSSVSIDNGGRNFCSALRGHRNFTDLCGLFVLLSGVSPVVLNRLTPGNHNLKIVPTGCGNDKTSLNVDFKI